MLRRPPNSTPFPLTTLVRSLLFVEQAEFQGSQRSWNRPGVSNASGLVDHKVISILISTVCLQWDRYTGSTSYTWRKKEFSEIKKKKNIYRNFQTKTRTTEDYIYKRFRSEMTLSNRRLISVELLHERAWQSTLQTRPSSKRERERERGREGGRKGDRKSTRLNSSHR